ncbi:hypothetical protein PoB_002452200 [Plakobranchus ocellatus]|uniref:Uncharacterized protein n=1 Tax=Plakobranchus ocellatus TaxID=259542 RepID=A0AAV3ZTZ9_9GAST|nr:hypothetical protein PoB_002452200 [Plakobranchus ocellatus]
MSQAGPVTEYPRNKNIAIKDPSAGKGIPEKLTNIVYPDHTTIEEVTDSLQSGVLPPQVVWSTHDRYSRSGLCAPWHGPRILPVDPTTAGTREKNIIEIKDPLTDKDVTEEVINSAYADHKYAEQDPSTKQHDEEIRKLFTRLVYDRLGKPSEDTSGAENLLRSMVQPTPEFWLHPDAHIPNEKIVSCQNPRVSQLGHVTTYPRNKKIIEIKDPSTGKDVTGELINSVRAVHTKEEPAFSFHIMKDIYSCMPPTF